MTLRPDQLWSWLSAWPNFLPQVAGAPQPYNVVLFLSNQISLFYHNPSSQANPFYYNPSSLVNPPVEDDPHSKERSSISYYQRKTVAHKCLAVGRRQWNSKACRSRKAAESRIGNKSPQPKGGSRVI